MHSHCRQRHSVVTLMTFASVSTARLWQNGHFVGRLRVSSALSSNVILIPQSGDYRAPEPGGCSIVNSASEVAEVKGEHHLGEEVRSHWLPLMKRSGRHLSSCNNEGSRYSTFAAELSSCRRAATVATESPNATPSRLEQFNSAQRVFRTGGTLG